MNKQNNNFGNKTSNNNFNNNNFNNNINNNSIANNRFNNNTFNPPNTPNYQVSGIVPNESANWQQQHIDPQQEKFIQNYNSYHSNSAFNNNEDNKQTLENQKNFQQYNIGQNFVEPIPMSLMDPMVYKQNTLYNNLHTNLMSEAVMRYKITIDSSDRNVLLYPNSFEYVINFGPVFRNDLEFAKPTLLESVREQERLNNKYIRKRNIPEPIVKKLDCENININDIYFEDETCKNNGKGFIIQNFKNVKYVEIQNVVLPQHNVLEINYDYNYCGCKKYKYFKDDMEHHRHNVLCNFRYVQSDIRDSLYRDRFIQMEIKELQSEYNLGTSESLNKNFVIFPDKPYGITYFRGLLYESVREYQTSLLGNINRFSISFYDSAGIPLNINTDSCKYEMEQIQKTKLINPLNIKIDDASLYSIFVNDFINYIMCFVAINHDISLLIPFYGDKEDCVYHQFVDECHKKTKLVKLSCCEFDVENIYESLNEFITEDGFIPVEKVTRGCNKKLVTIQEYLMSIMFYPNNKNLEPLMFNYESYGLNLLKKLKLEILEIPKRKNLQNTISLVIGVYQNEMNTMINYTSQR